MLISNLNASASAYHEKMRSINEAMKAHKIELRLQARVRRFYEFQWLHQRGVKSEFVSELPEARRPLHRTRPPACSFSFALRLFEPRQPRQLRPASPAPPAHFGAVRLRRRAVARARQPRSSHTPFASPRLLWPPQALRSDIAVAQYASRLKGVHLFESLKEQACGDPPPWQALPLRLAAVRGPPFLAATRRLAASRTDPLYCRGPAFR